MGTELDSLPMNQPGFSWRRCLNTVGPVLALIAIYLLFAWIEPSFRSTAPMRNIARQTTPVAVAALGMTLVIISGGIDLSVGSAVALGAIAIAWLLEFFRHALGGDAGQLSASAQIWVPIVAALGGVLLCAAFGAAAGTIITGLRVVPFIVTLGMMLVIRGAAKWISHEQKIDTPYTWLTDLMAMLPPERRWMLVPPGVWILLLLAVLVALMLRYTRLGRHIFAVGSNEMTARLCGVAVQRVKVIVYTLSGAFAGMGSLMFFSRISVGDPTAAQGMELDVIAAVVIGGGSLSGGEGSILGTLVGALIMGTIRAGCQQKGWPTYVQEIITGLIIIAAVALDRLRHRRSV